MVPLRGSTGLLCGNGMVLCQHDTHQTVKDFTAILFKHDKRGMMVFTVQSQFVGGIISPHCFLFRTALSRGSLRFEYKQSYFRQ